MGIIKNIFKNSEEEKAEQKVSQGSKTAKKTVSKSSEREEKKSKGTTVKEKDEKKKQEKKKDLKEQKVSTQKKEEKELKVEKRTDDQAYKILSEPMITEKATDLLQMNKYCFAVPSFANKKQVEEKIMNIYGVKPIKINIVKKIGKKVRRGRIIGKTKDYKKAVVTLKPGEKIEIYEG